MPWLVYLQLHRGSETKSLLVECGSKTSVHDVMQHVLDPQILHDWKLAEYSTLYTAQKIKQKFVTDLKAPVSAKFVTLRPPGELAKVLD